MKDKAGNDAPNFYFAQNDEDQDSNENDQNETESNQVLKRVQEVEEFADFLMSTNPEEIKCEKDHGEKQDCEECERLIDKVKKYQSHSHTFTCAKKKKIMTIKENEGHGRLDGLVKGPSLSNIQICRFRFPKFPLDETKFVMGLPKETDADLIKKYKLDLNKITKYLVRQTWCNDQHRESESFNKIKGLDFWQFLFEVGMFDHNKQLEEFTD